MPCGHSLPELLLLFLLLLPDAKVAEQEVPPCPARCACSAPREIHCPFRSLTSFPAGVWRRVERVNLGYNVMTSLPAAALAGLSRLRLLLLHGNEIEEIQDGAMRDLGALQVLKLSHNRLRALMPGTLQGAQSLTRLHLDHNRLESLHADALLGLTRLRLLTLEGNALTTLPPGALATFDLLPLRGRGHGTFSRASTLRHLSLADNALTSLPPAVLPAAPLLETLALHGNPWACDCARASWVGAWTARVRAALRCRRDRGATTADAWGGASCALCASPAHYRDRDLRDLGANDFSCAAPALRSPLRKNNETRGQEEVDDSGDDIITLGVPGDDVIGVDMVDAHGTRVALACDPRAAGPPRVTNVRAVAEVYPDAEGTGLAFEAAVTLDLACAVTSHEGGSGEFERAWRLLAYYGGEARAVLMAADGSGSDDDVTARYAQDPDADDTTDAAPYYTGLRVNLTTPSGWAWLHAPRRLRLHLDRKRTTSRRIVMTFEARLSRTLRGDGSHDVRDDADGDDVTPWVAIAPDVNAGGGVLAHEGDEVRLPCDVTASAMASVTWRLPGGAVVTKMLAAPDNIRARVRGGGEHRGSPRDDVTVLGDGSLLLPAVRADDPGRYMCVATTGATAQDRAVRRLLVTSSRSGPSPDDDAVATLRVSPGAALTLPCAISGVNIAAVAWELPGGRLLRRGENASSSGTNAAVDRNGSLALTLLRGGDSGRFQCVAVNQAGSDAFAVEVAVVDVAGVRSDHVTGGGDVEEASGAGPGLRAADARNGGRTGGNRSSSRTGSRKLAAEKKRNRNSVPRRLKPPLPPPRKVTSSPGPWLEQPPQRLMAEPNVGVVTGANDVTGEGDFTASRDNVIGGTDVADGGGVTGRGCAKSSYDVINATGNVIAPNVTAANISAPSAEEEGTETEEEESVEAPPVTFPGLRDVIPAPSPAPVLRFQPGSNSGSTAGGDNFRPWPASSASTSSDQLPPRGGGFQFRPVGAFLPHRKGPWGFPLPTTSDPDPPTSVSGTPAWGTTQATPTGNVTTTTVRDHRRGRKRVRNWGRQAPPPTPSPAQLQLPVPEAPPPEVQSPLPPWQKPGRKSPRRRPIATSAGRSWEPEVVTSGGRLSASSPVRHAGLVTSLPAESLTPGGVTEVFADITLFSLNAATETATYDVIGGTEDDITAQTAADDITMFTGISADDITAPTDDVTVATTYFGTDDVIHAFVTPDLAADLEPGTLAAFPLETAGDVTASTPDDVIGDVIAVPGAGDVIAHPARPLPDALPASGSAEAPSTPAPALPAPAPPPALEAETSQSEEKAATTPPWPPRQEVAVAAITVTPPPLPAVRATSRPLPIRQEAAVFPPQPPQAPPSFLFSLPRTAGVTPRSTPPLPPAPGIPLTLHFQPPPWIHAHLGPPAPPVPHGLYHVMSRDLVAAAPVTSSMTSLERKPLVHVRRGSRLRLRCEAVGFSAPRVVWRLPSGRLLGRGTSPAPRVALAPDSSLLVAPVTERDTGDYACLAGDAHAAVTIHVLADPAPSAFTSGSYRVGPNPTVTPAPHASAAVPVIFARVGSSVRVSCWGAAAAGSAVPVMWLLPDGSRVMSSSAPVMSLPRTRVDPRGWLALWPLTPGDTGLYRCWAPGGGTRAVFVRVD